MVLKHNRSMQRKSRTMSRPLVTLIVLYCTLGNYFTLRSYKKDKNVSPHGVDSNFMAIVPQLLQLPVIRVLVRDVEGGLGREDI